MRTNRKTEEKKMSMSKNIARLAVTAGLTAALSFGGVMAPVTMAFADDGDNSITITQSEGNASTTFKAYQIFKADVVDPTEEGRLIRSSPTSSGQTTWSRVFRMPLSRLLKRIRSMRLLILSCPIRLPPRTWPIG